jgi:hypothetical protein
MDESNYHPLDDMRSTEELIAIALTTNFDEEAQDEIGIFSPAQQARLALKQRATLEVLQAAQKLCVSQIPNERSVGGIFLAN